MAATFEDFLAAGKIETKQAVMKNGLEIEIRSLTAEESFKAEDLREKSLSDFNYYLVKHCLVSPKISDSEIKQLGELSGKLFNDILETIIKTLNPEGFEAQAEKN